MAGKKNEKTDYAALIKALREKGPARLYLLWGEEDYLRASFFEEIKKAVLTGGADDFNYHKLAGDPLNADALAEAVDSVPFMGGQSLIEVRDFEINSCKDSAAERLIETMARVAISAWTDAREEATRSIRSTSVNSGERTSTRAAPP